MVNKIKILTFFFLFLNFHCSSQETNLFIDEILEKQSLSGEPRKVISDLIKKNKGKNLSRKIRYLLDVMDDQANGTKKQTNQIYWLINNSNSNEYNLKIIVYIKIAKILILNNDYVNSEMYLLKALYLSKKNNPLFLKSIYEELTTIYSSKKKYEKAIYTTKKCIQFIKKDNYIEKSSFINNIGYFYEGQKKYDLYYKYVNEAIKTLDSNNTKNAYHYHFRAILIANLGDYFKYKNNSKKAIEYYLKSIETLNKNDLDGKRIVIYLKLIELYENQNEKSKVQDLINKILYFFKNEQDKKRRYQNSSSLANNYLSKLSKNDQFEVLRDCQKSSQEFNNEIIQKNNEISNLNSIILNYLLKREIKVAQKTESDKRKSIIYITVLILSVVLMLFLLFYFKTKNKIRIQNEKETNLILEKKLTEIDSDLKNERLNKLLLNQNIKSEIQKDLLDELKKLKRKKNTTSDEIIRFLQFKINSLSEIDKKMAENDNQMYKFKDHYMTFLKTKFDVLTKNDLIICTYLKLGLSSKEIGIIEGINESSVRVYKTRIKNKLNISIDQKLEDFITSLKFKL
jgi:hypothetical protein